MPPPQAPNSPAGNGSSTQPPAVDYQGGKAKQLLERCIEAVRKDTARLDRDKQDWLNILGYHGGPANWWVTWDGVSNVWREIPSDDSEYGLPPEVPRAASNIYRRKIDGMASILNQSAPAQEWRPAKDDDSARATADIIDDVLPVLREECEYDQQRGVINKFACLTDKAAFEVYFDTDEKYGTDLIQALECPACGWKGMPMELANAEDPDTAACPQCGAPAGELEPMIHPLTAEPVGVHYPKGKICGRLYPSFEVSLPPNARECNERKVPYILTHSSWAREDAMRTWPKAAAKIKMAKAETSAANTSSQYATAVRNISSPNAAARGVMPQTTDTVLVWRLQHDPIQDEIDGFNFPEGLDAVMIDGDIIDAGPLPLKDDQGQPMKTILLRTYIQSPGSPFGIPPADDLGVLQRQRNLIETLMLLILLHDASPTTWVPTTVTLEDELERRPGSVHRYRSNGLGNERPFTEPGINPPEGLFKFIELNDQAFDTVSGLNAVLEGQRPQGDPTLGEVNTLVERGMAAFQEPLQQLTGFEIRLSYVLLQTARQSLWTARLIRSVGENGEWAIKQFTSADLHGAVDVYVNPSSAWPKSQVLQHLRLKEVVQMGVLNPQDPEIQEQILSDYDLTHFKPSLDRDRKQIARELDRWKVAQTPQDIAPPGLYINLAMHVFYKSQWMKTEEAEAIQQSNQPVWQAMNQHIQMLKQMAAPPPQPTAGPPAAPGKQAPDGSVLAQKLHAGVLKPAAGKPGSPLDHMVASGHLVPAPPQATAAPPPDRGGRVM